MTTLEIVPKKSKPERSAEEQAVKGLVRLAREQGLALTGPDGLLQQFTKSVLETALNEEMTEHLGPASTSGGRKRTLLRDAGGSRATAPLVRPGSCNVLFRTLHQEDTETRPICSNDALGSLTSR